ncbi:integrator complex subunit 4-like, partial [Saccoglossus kowalevskii]|uniref:Integrator complex subunit 4-like n=1 Tax=Saccoglossus kowalevskii TaxID=10224 RepID=A0ABM0MG78_SACKO
VQLPDGTTQLITPRTCDFKKLSPLKYRLLTQVYVSHGVWSEPCSINFCVVMSHRDDTQPQAVLDPGQSSATEEKGIIELCKPVKVYLLPKPAKR